MPCFFVYLIIYFHFHSSSSVTEAPANNDVVDMAKVTVKTCEGVFTAFRTDKDLKASLQNYALYCAVGATAEYVMDTFGKYHQVYHASCNGKGGVLRTKKHSHRACDNCDKLRKSRGPKILQTMKERSKKLIAAKEALKRSELAPSDYDKMKKFIKTGDDFFCSKGIELKRRVQAQVDYYESVESLANGLKKKLLKSSCGMVPSNDKFLKTFLKLYQSDGKGDDFKQSLIMCLMRAYVAKASGNDRPLYSTKVLNFMMALSTTNVRAFSLASANLCSVSIRHMRLMKARNRDVPLLLRSKSDMIRLLSMRIAMIRHDFGESSMRVAFSIGVDATVVVKGYQYLYSEGKVVGGAAPNHIHDVSGKNKEELKSFLKDCIDGKNGDIAAECKMAVVSFQKVPPGMSPYFMLGGLPQTVNDSNDWGKDVMKIAVEATEKVGNAVLLNHSTDGVSCEVQWNLDQLKSFLQGKSNQLALTDTNHNAKNLRYQLIGGSSVASIGKFAVDPWLLKLASGLPKDVVEKPPSKETIRWTDWASDALVLGLASPNVVESLLKVKTHDEGNLLVSEMILRLCPDLFPC